jgi:hypothetical protein
VFQSWIRKRRRGVMSDYVKAAHKWLHPLHLPPMGSGVWEQQSCLSRKIPILLPEAQILHLALLMGLGSDVGKDRPMSPKRAADLHKAHSIGVTGRTFCPMEGAGQVQVMLCFLGLCLLPLRTRGT